MHWPASRAVLGGPLAGVVVGVVVGVIAATVLMLVAPVPAAAAPSKVCTPTDERLAEVSGLVAVNNGYAAIADGGDELQVLTLNAKCEVVDTLSTGVDPFDPEDLGRARDGTLWVADIGDNERERDSVAVHEIALDSEQSVLHRMTYPDGPHDAEAMVVPPDRRPVIITKDPAGTAAVYVATAALPQGAGDAAVPLKKAGTWTIKPTGTSGGPIGRIGQIVVTGAVLSTDGTRLAARTYTDAYEWTLSGGANADKVVAALTKSKPVVTPMPDEPQGESIGYTLDGKAFVTISEGGNAPLQRWGRAAPPKPSAKPSAKDDGGFDIALPDLSLLQISMIVAALGALGMILTAFGFFGIRRARRRAREEARRNPEGRHADARHDDDGDDRDDRYDDEYDDGPYDDRHDDRYDEEARHEQGRYGDYDDDYDDDRRDERYDDRHDDEYDDGPPPGRDDYSDDYPAERERTRDRVPDRDWDRDERGGERLFDGERTIDRGRASVPVAPPPAEPEPQLTGSHGDALDSPIERARRGTVYGGGPRNS